MSPLVCIDLDAMSGRMVSSEARYCLSTFVLPPGCPVPYASDSSGSAPTKMRKGPRHRGPFLERHF
jgi:hypothetical protein